MEKIAFPAGFIWGAASSAYQCEGSPLADGATASNWQEFTRRRGVIKDGTTGDTACDNYHRYPEDIAEMQRDGPESLSVLCRLGEDISRSRTVERSRARPL